MEFLQSYKGIGWQINIIYQERKGDIPPRIQVGCLFLNKPTKNECKLYNYLLRLQMRMWEAKFGIASDGDIVLMVDRSAVDLDESELQDMVITVATFLKEFRDECYEIVK